MWVESDDVSTDPGSGGGVGGADCDELVVGYADDDPDLGFGQGFENVRVGIVETDVGDFLKLEKRYELGWGEQIRNVCAYIHSDKWLFTVGILDLLLESCVQLRRFSCYRKQGIDKNC